MQIFDDNKNQKFHRGKHVTLGEGLQVSEDDTGLPILTAHSGDIHGMVMSGGLAPENITLMTTHDVPYEFHLMPAAITDYISQDRIKYDASKYNAARVVLNVVSGGSPDSYGFLQYAQQDAGPWLTAGKFGYIQRDLVTLGCEAGPADFLASGARDDVFWRTVFTSGDASYSPSLGLIAVQFLWDDRPEPTAERLYFCNCEPTNYSSALAAVQFSGTYEPIFPELDNPYTIRGISKGRFTSGTGVAIDGSGTHTGTGSAISFSAGGAAVGGIALICPPGINDTWSYSFNLPDISPDTYEVLVTTCNSHGTATVVGFPGQCSPGFLSPLVCDPFYFKLDFAGVSTQELMSYYWGFGGGYTIPCTTRTVGVTSTSSGGSVSLSIAAKCNGGYHSNACFIGGVATFTPDGGVVFFPGTLPVLNMRRNSTSGGGNPWDEDSTLGGQACNCGTSPTSITAFTASRVRHAEGITSRIVGPPLEAQSVPAWNYIVHSAAKMDRTPRWAAGKIWYQLRVLRGTSIVREVGGGWSQQLDNDLRAIEVVITSSAFNVQAGDRFVIDTWAIVDIDTAGDTLITAYGPITGGDISEIYVRDADGSAPAHYYEGTDEQFSPGQIIASPKSHLELPALLYQSDTP